MTLRKLWTRLQGPEVEAGGGGGSAPAPSPAPAPASPAPAPASGADAPSGSSSASDKSGVIEDFDFGTLVDHHEGREPSAAAQLEQMSGAPAPSPAAPAPSPAQPAPSPAAPAPAPAPAAPAPAPSPAEPAPSPAPATATDPASGAQPPQPIDWEKHRQEFLPKLEKVYALSEEEIQDFQTNPGTALPKLAAKLHYNMNLALQSALREAIPHFVQGQIQQNRLRDKYENEFYAKWPALKEAVGKDPKVEETINQGLAAYKTANPKATIADLIDKVGLLTMISLGLNPMQQAPAPSPAPAPAAPISIPGRPAGVGGQGHVPRPASPGGSSQSDEDFYGDLANHWNSGGG